MRFSLYTLVDITETRARRGEDPKLMRQQQNFSTVLQTIGLRVNPTYVDPPKIINIPEKIEFGKIYKNIKKCWKYTFDIEYEGAINLDMLSDDFHLIPIIKDLDEEIELEITAFDTKNPDKFNILFREEDK